MSLASKPPEASARGRVSASNSFSRSLLERVLVDISVLHDQDKVAVGVGNEVEILQGIAVDQYQIRIGAFLDHAERPLLS